MLWSVRAALRPANFTSHRFFSSFSPQGCETSKKRYNFIFKLHASRKLGQRSLTLPLKHSGPSLRALRSPHMRVLTTGVRIVIQKKQP